MFKTRGRSVPLSGNPMVLLRFRSSGCWNDGPNSIYFDPVKSTKKLSPCPTCFCAVSWKAWYIEYPEGEPALTEVYCGQGRNAWPTVPVKVGQGLVIPADAMAAWVAASVELM